MRELLSFLFVSLAVPPAAASAQHPTTGEDAAATRLASGPTEGTGLQPLVVYAPSGPRAGLEFDAATAVGDGPGAFLFIHEISRNVAPMIRGFDRIAQTHRPLGLNAFAVRIAADRTAAERQLEATSGALRMVHPMVISVDGAEGPGSYALNRRCTLTLVVAKGGKVQESLGFTDTGQNDVVLMRSLIERATGELPDDPGELRRLASERLPKDPDALRALAAQLALEQSHLASMPPRAPARDRARNMRDRRGGAQGRPTSRPAAARGGDATPGQRRREGAPPDDPQLLSLLRSYIHKDAAAERVDDVYARIVERVGEDEGLRGQAVEMFRLMLSLDYGTEAARAKARQYVEKHGDSRGQEHGKNGDKTEEVREERR